MRLKSIFTAFIALLFTVLLVSCGGSSQYYYASQTPDQNSGWIYYVIVEKKGDKIVDIEWNSFHIEGNLSSYKGKNKYQASLDGDYVMVPNNAIMWHHQSDLLAQQIIDNQSVNVQLPIPAGVSINDKNIYQLVEKALASDPIPKGNYKDGHYVLEADKTDRAAIDAWDPVLEVKVTSPAFKYYDFGIFNVVNGTIVEAYFNAAFTQYRYQLDSNNKVVKTDSDPSLPIIDSNTIYKTKNQLGLSYAMKKPNGPGNFEYDEAAYAFGDYLIENQTKELPTLKDGKTDAIAGVTITVSGFYQIVEKIPTK